LLLQTITKSKEELLQAKDAEMQAITKSKDDLLQTITKSKEELLQAKDAEIRLLHADNARLSAQAAAAGAAPPPAPAPAAARAAAASAEAVFQEGQQLYGEQRFSEAAERWGRAALQQHGPSHAHLSDMLIEGRPGVAKEVNRAFELAFAGAALGCAHSKHSAAATLWAMVLLKMKREGLRWEGRALRRAAALGSLWLDCATSLDMAALRRTMPRLCDCTALQLIRETQTLSSTWATCLRMV
jgi:hypothetical protein